MLLSRVRSIRQKLMVVVMTATLAALATAGAAMVIYDIRAYQQTWVNDLTTQADILGQAAAPALQFNDPRAARESLSLLRARPQIPVAAIYTAKGAVFASYPEDAKAKPSLPTLPEADGWRIEGRELLVFRRIVDNNEILGSVFLRARYELVERLVSYLSILGVVFLASLVVAGLLSFGLNAAVSRPIIAISDVAREVMRTRDFSLRATKTTADEIGLLADDFNEMLAEIGRRADILLESNRSLEREIVERREAELALQHAEEELRSLNADLERRVTERTAQLQAAHKDMESFSYSVSHDLRAPLRAIAGFSQLLAVDHSAQLDAEALRKLGHIQGEAQRMGVLIDDLLAFSRLGRQKVKHSDLDMRTMAAGMFEQLHAHHQGPRAQLLLGSLPRGLGDNSLVNQVWANLISNALKFSSKVPSPVIEIGAISDEESHTYFVRDNGAGFDPRYQNKLFGVFQRLHTASEFPGTGVGLALVERIVSRHGGRVWAQSRPGEGATFYFTLPREKERNDGDG